jgi:hypothetical protein
MKLDDITKQRTAISRKCDAAVCINGGVVCVEAMNQSHGVLYFDPKSRCYAHSEFLCTNTWDGRVPCLGFTVAPEGHSAKITQNEVKNEDTLHTYYCFPPVRFPFLRRISGSHFGGYEEFYTSDILSPSSGYSLPTWWHYVPPKFRLNFQRTTRIYIPEDRTRSFYVFYPSSRS